MTTGTGPQRGYPIENASGMDIPPRSIVMVTGVTYASDKQKSWSTVDRYNGDPGNIMVTGPVTIPSQMTNTDDALVNGRGVAYYDDFIYVSVDPALTSMVAGDELGPVDGEWFIGAAGNGFVAQGDLLPDSDPPRAQFYRSGGGGGGAARVRFTILSTAFSEVLGAIGCDFVTARVNYISCNSTDVAVGDEIRIFDPEYCHFNLPIELLVGLCGTATSMDAAEFIASRDAAYSLPECLYALDGQSCIWMIDTLCCAEEEEVAT